MKRRRKEIKKRNEKEIKEGGGGNRDKEKMKKMRGKIN